VHVPLECLFASAVPKYVGIDGSALWPKRTQAAVPDVRVVLTRLSGNPDLYVSLTDPSPSSSSYDWMSSDVEGDVVQIPHTDATLANCTSQAKQSTGGAPCTVYMAVVSAQKNSAFSLLADTVPVGAGFHVESPANLAGDYTFTASTFGAPLPLRPMTRAVVAAQPAAACPPAGASASWGLTNAASLVGAIALVDRGSNCPYPGRYFANKVKAAQTAGAAAVIVADNVDHGDTLVAMGTSRWLPAYPTSPTEPRLLLGLCHRFSSSIPSYHPSFAGQWRHGKERHGPRHLRLVRHGRQAQDGPSDAGWRARHSLAAEWSAAAARRRSPSMCTTSIPHGPASPSRANGRAVWPPTGWGLAWQGRAWGRGVPEGISALCPP